MDTNGDHVRAHRELVEGRRQRGAIGAFFVIRGLIAIPSAEDIVAGVSPAEADGARLHLLPRGSFRPRRATRLDRSPPQSWTVAPALPLGPGVPGLPAFTRL